MTAQDQQKPTETANDLPQETSQRQHSLWVERLSLSNFRSYAHAQIETGPTPVVLTGANGAGKTNILEAVSLLSSGQGLRRAAYIELMHQGQQPRPGSVGWAVAARANTRCGFADIGTGLQTGSGDQSQYYRNGQQTRVGRTVRINGETCTSPRVLNDYMDIVWLTPSMDGLFIGPASDRRRFLDRLVYCFDPAFRKFTGRFERATQSRNRLLADGVRDHRQLESFEVIMAETGTAIAAARLEAVTALQSVIDERRNRSEASPFPWCLTHMQGSLESALETAPAIDVEDNYRENLANNREQDRAAGRTLEGPHRSDLLLTHGPKDMPARICSTGEQKILLLGLVLAQADLIARRHEGSAPIILLDEIFAHLDFERRQALFSEILELKAQAWMTGTDAEIFEPLSEAAQMFVIEESNVVRRPKKHFRS